MYVRKKRKMLISQGEHPGSGWQGCPDELSDEGTRQAGYFSYTDV